MIDTPACVDSMQGAPSLSVVSSPLYSSIYGAPGALKHDGWRKNPACRHLSWLGRSGTRSLNGVALEVVTIRRAELHAARDAV